MSIALDLRRHASDLLKNPAEISDVILRRSVSASYYALFHYINDAAVSLLAPNVSEQTNHRIQRWFDHAMMKQICGRFLKPKLDNPLLDLIGESASSELQLVCRTFINLQEARHQADYNLDYSVDYSEALKLTRSALTAMLAVDIVKQSAGGNIFILSLLLWKNWEKDR